jgi:ElaB/YqjD/DUF883 family membrane-anchored ribosome-binding protein
VCGIEFALRAGQVHFPHDKKGKYMVDRQQETTKEQAARETSVPPQQGTSSTATIRDKVQEGVAQMRDKTHELGDQAKELSVQAQQTAAEYYQQGREGLLELQHTMEAQIHQKPIQSLLIAGGIGLLLGLLWRRR